MTQEKLDITYNDSLDNIRGWIDEDRFARVINIFAIPGAGKSHFLETLHSTYKNNRPTCLLKVSEPYFSGEEEPRVFRMAPFLGDLLQEIEAFGGDEAPRKTKGHGDIEGLVDNLLNLLQTYANRDPRQPVLIIIDDYDQMPSQSRAQFEETVLSKIIRLPVNSIALLSSQQPLEFNNRLDIAERFEPFMLRGASVDDIKQALPEEQQPLANRIKEWTQGMPRLVEYLINQSVQMNVTTEVEFDEHLEALINDNYRDKLRKVSFGKGTTPQKDTSRIELTEKCLDPLSLLRRFDVSILRGLLPNLKEIEIYFKDKPQKEYLNLIRDLGSRVRWLPDGGGYRLDPMLKEMLYAYIRQNDLPYFRSVNQQMIYVCEQLLKKRYHQGHFVELIYHKWELAQLDGVKGKKLAKYMERILVDEFGNHVPTIPNDNPLETDNLNNLIQGLQRDEILAAYVTDSFISEAENRLPG